MPNTVMVTDRTVTAGYWRIIEWLACIYRRARIPGVFMDGLMPVDAVMIVPKSGSPFIHHPQLYWHCDRA